MWFLSAGHLGHGDWSPISSCINSCAGGFMWTIRQTPSLLDLTMLLSPPVMPTHKATCDLISIDYMLHTRLVGTGINHGFLNDWDTSITTWNTALANKVRVVFSDKRELVGLCFHTFIHQLPCSLWCMYRDDNWNIFKLVDRDLWIAWVHWFAESIHSNLIP